jgi:hypothetical protein
MLDKAGVYKMICPHDGCNATYIGETCRALSIRAGEHIRHIINNRPEQSAIAEHALEYNHKNIQKSDFNIIASINNKTRLRVCESMHIHKNNNNLINRDTGYVQNSCLFDLL